MPSVIAAVLGLHASVASDRMRTEVTSSSRHPPEPGRQSKEAEEADQGGVDRGRPNTEDGGLRRTRRSLRRLAHWILLSRNVSSLGAGGRIGALLSIGQRRMCHYPTSVVAAVNEREPHINSDTT